MTRSLMPSQQRLLDIAAAFNLAALEKQSDPVFELRLLDVMEYRDIRALKSLSEKIRGLKKRFGDAAKDNRLYARTVFDLTDKIAELYEKFCRPDELDQCIPADARIKEIIDAFDRRGLKAFARICRPDMTA